MTILFLRDHDNKFQLCKTGPYQPSFPLHDAEIGCENRKSHDLSIIKRSLVAMRCQLHVLANCDLS